MTNWYPFQYHPRRQDKIYDRAGHFLGYVQLEFGSAVFLTGERLKPSQISWEQENAIKTAQPTSFFVAWNIQPQIIGGEICMVAGTHFQLSKNCGWYVSYHAEHETMISGRCEFIIVDPGKVDFPPVLFDPDQMQPPFRILKHASSTSNWGMLAELLSEHAKVLVVRASEQWESPEILRNIEGYLDIPQLDGETPTNRIPVFGSWQCSCHETKDQVHGSDQDSCPRCGTCREKGNMVYPKLKRAFDKAIASDPAGKPMSLFEGW